MDTAVTPAQLAAHTAMVMLGGLHTEVRHPIRSESWRHTRSDEVLSRNASNVCSRGHYSDAVLSSLESQNDAEVEGITAKVKMLKNVRALGATELFYQQNHD